MTRKWGSIDHCGSGVCSAECCFGAGYRIEKNLSMRRFFRQPADFSVTEVKNCPVSAKTSVARFRETSRRWSRVDRVALRWFRWAADCGDSEIRCPFAEPPISDVTANADWIPLITASHRVPLDETAPLPAQRIDKTQAPLSNMDMPLFQWYQTQFVNIVI